MGRDAWLCWTPRHSSHVSGCINAISLCASGFSCLVLGLACRLLSQTSSIVPVNPSGEGRGSGDVRTRLAARLGASLGFKDAAYYFSVFFFSGPS